MLDIIDDLLDRHFSVCTRAELLAVVTRHELDQEIRRGRLVRLAPRCYARPWTADDSASHELAAAKSAGPVAALSHLTALRRWGLPSRPSAIHLTTTIGQRVTSRGGVVVHRTRRPIAARLSAGAGVETPDWAVVTSWPMMSGTAQRAPVIRAVAGRLATVAGIRSACEQHPTLRGRADLMALLALIGAGCHSELELWGYRRVFDIRELRGAVRQRTVVVRGQVYYLDLAYENEKVAVELDGRAFHAAPSQWERDIARDLALATAGWQTVRLSHRRLTTDVDGCRRDVVRVLAARRKRPGVEP